MKAALHSGAECVPLTDLSDMSVLLLLLLRLLGTELRALGQSASESILRLLLVKCATKAKSWL